MEKRTASITVTLTMLVPEGTSDAVLATALDALSAVMLVQAEDGLYLHGSPDAFGLDDEPNRHICDVSNIRAQLDAESAYRGLVDQIGWGFHPDTPGDDYTSLPAGVTPEQVDRVIGAALAARVDVYGIALDWLQRAERDD